MGIIENKNKLLQRKKGITTRELVPTGRSLKRSDIDNFVNKMKNIKDEYVSNKKNDNLNKIKTVRDVIEPPKHQEQIINENSISKEKKEDLSLLSKSELKRRVSARFPDLKITSRISKSDLINTLNEGE